MNEQMNMANEQSSMLTAFLYEVAVENPRTNVVWDIRFVIVPETEKKSRMFVFRTDLANYLGWSTFNMVNSDSWCKNNKVKKMGFATCLRASAQYYLLENTDSLKKLIAQYYPHQLSNMYRSACQEWQHCMDALDWEPSKWAHNGEVSCIVNGYFYKPNNKATKAEAQKAPVRSTHIIEASKMIREKLGEAKAKLERAQAEVDKYTIALETLEAI